MAGFQVTLRGRIWVTAEEGKKNRSQGCCFWIESAEDFRHAG